MSRTSRNRKTVPDKWTVRDGNHLYYMKTDEFGRKHGVRPTKFRRGWLSKENKPARQEWHQQHRMEVKTLMSQENWDAIRPPRKTSGWNTW